MTSWACGDFSYIAQGNASEGKKTSVPLASPEPQPKPVLHPRVFSGSSSEPCSFGSPALTAQYPGPQCLQYGSRTLVLRISSSISWSSRDRSPTPLNPSVFKSGASGAGRHHLRAGHRLFQIRSHKVFGRSNRSAKMLTQHIVGRRCASYSGDLGDRKNERLLPRVRRPAPCRTVDFSVHAIPADRNHCLSSIRYPLGSQISALELGSHRTLRWSKGDSNSQSRHGPP
jgi:hypothetical protein